MIRLNDLRCHYPLNLRHGQSSCNPQSAIRNPQSAIRNQNRLRSRRILRRRKSSSRHLSRHSSRSRLSLNLNLPSRHLSRHSSRSRLSLNLNLPSRSHLSPNLDLGPRPSHRPSRASCPLMNFSAFLSLKRPRLCLAKVSPDIARLTAIAKMVISRENRSVLSLSIETPCLNL